MNEVRELVRSMHPALPDNVVPSQCEGYELRQSPCCYYLVNLAANRVVKLNESGALIWGLCDGECNVGAIIEMLEENYPDAADQIRKDVYRVLQELQEEGLIQPL